MNSDPTYHPYRGGICLVARLLLLLTVAACSPPTPPETPAATIPDYHDFSNPQPVTIRGYDGDAMQPFITPDGQFLLFNNRNDPREDSQLHIAERIDDLNFHYLGEMVGVNSDSLDAAPSVDEENRLYFVSMRSYSGSYATIYRARFDAGVATQVELVPGASEHIPGRVSFDASISRDGNILMLVDGRFGGTSSNLPTTAEIAMAMREGDAFQRLSANRTLLGNVNAPGTLNYAPTLSADLRELFFTRLVPAGRSPEPVILRAARDSPDEAFGMPQRVAAIDGYAEAPALSPDGRSLYYAKRDKTNFAIFRVTRQ